LAPLARHGVGKGNGSADTSREDQRRLKPNTRASPAWRGAEHGPVGHSWSILNPMQGRGRATSGACVRPLCHG